MNTIVKKIVVVGGGTAGWMSAALISSVLKGTVEVELVESDDIGIIGVGEATIPPIRLVNSVLGIDEAEFMRETKATVKLAIRFEGWKEQGQNYYHTFGDAGVEQGFCSFHHFCQAGSKVGFDTNIWDYDLNFLCCEQGKFAKMNVANPIWDIPYAYHFDAALYGQYLRSKCEKLGVKRTEGYIESVELDPTAGHVTSLTLRNGQSIKGDLFIDCSGATGLLIQKALNTGFEDWSHWLPCDRAVTVPTEHFKQTKPFTRSIAQPYGWQWAIPLQHRNGNGLVYSSRYCSDEEAINLLLNNLESKAIGEPSVLRFKTGRVKKQWNKNVVAIGLASGFLEPLESTSIYLIQSAIVRLLKLFPSGNLNTVVVDEYNKQSKSEFEAVRDFIILHYYLNERSDSQFWIDQRNMVLPERLADKINLFKENGYIAQEELDIFKESSWVQVMLGQGLTPKSNHPIAANMSKEELVAYLQKIEKTKREPLDKIPLHNDFLKLMGGAIK